MDDLFDITIDRITKKVNFMKLQYLLFSITKRDADHDVDVFNIF